MRGKASAEDREYFRRLGRAKRALRRTERPPETLAEALDRMYRIERNHGLDLRSPHAQAIWSDRRSHFAYLKAIRALAAKARRANGSSSEDEG